MSMIQRKGRHFLKLVKNNMSNLMFATWSAHNPLTISFRGTGEQFKKFINSLVDDFEEEEYEELDTDSCGDLGEDFDD